MTTPNEITRVEQDLETVRQASGIGLPFGREDVIVELVAAGGVAVLGFVSIFVTGYWLRLALLPALGPLVVSQTWLRLKYRRSTGRSAVRRREYTAGFAGGLVSMALLLTFHWSGLLAHAHRHLIYAAFACGIGVALMMVGIADSGRRRYVGGAAGLLMAGLGIVFFYETHVVAVVAAASVGGLLADAAIMIYQLRRGRAAA
ncbi:hypothetical protein LCGC14_1661000 [marine sediment metagenome]|uniref:Uncharacterized protein n=1 Tax=marine sediment metagenome TaxID=412755 RepID=A0A0F9KU43_9ZZZZ